VKDLLVTGSYSYDYTSIKTNCTVSAAAAATGLCVQDTNDPDAVYPGAHPVGTGGLQSVKGDPLPNAPMHKLGVDVAYTWHFTPGDLTFSGSYAYRSSQDGTMFNRPYDNAPSWDNVDLRALWKSPGDKYEIIAYVKNVFNSLEYDVGAQGVGLLGNSKVATTAATGLIESNVYEIAPPRTFGVEVRYKFF
jgi:iron complex outermembrane recepter protein